LLSGIGRVSAGGVILGGGFLATTALSGGTEIVGSGGTTSTFAVTAGGKEIVNSAGIAVGTIVKSGGREQVVAGKSIAASIRMSAARYCVPAPSRSLDQTTSVAASVPA
jgi:antigen 43